MPIERVLLFPAKNGPFVSSAPVNYQELWSDSTCLDARLFIFFIFVVKDVGVVSFI